MAHWVRIIANPKILKRFIKTPEGKRAAFKYGKMALESEVTKKAVKKFVDRNGHDLAKNKKYREQEQKYRQLQARIDELEQQVAQMKNNESELQTKTFSLGRAVVEMRELYNQMVQNLNNIQSRVITQTARVR